MNQSFFQPSPALLKMWRIPQKTGLIKCFSAIFPGADKMINYSIYPFNRSWSTSCASWWKLKIRCLFLASCCGCIPRNISELKLLRTCSVFLPALYLFLHLFLSFSLILNFNNSPYIWNKSFLQCSISPPSSMHRVFGGIIKFNSGKIGI